MGRRGNKSARVDAARAPTAAREELERAWRSRVTRAPELAACVTAGGAGREPFHRWIPYAQGFSPELVRRYLQARAQTHGPKDGGFILDPFSGSGTTVIECGRQGVHARGVEASPALAFLTTVMGEREFPPLPPLPLADSGDWRATAERLEHPLHRAALMLAVARRHTSSGKPHPHAPPLDRSLQEVAPMMRDDLRTPLAVANPVFAGDALGMAVINDGCVGGVLTSPPYVSRHDYARIVSPYEVVYLFWHPEAADQSRERDRRLRATVIPPGRTARTAASKTPVAQPPYVGLEPAHPALVEAVAVLRANREDRLAELVVAYFADLGGFLVECLRVSRPGALLWIVIGGARLKGVYVPSDLLLAELAEAMGFTVLGIEAARNLINVGRKLGGLVNVAPRESVVRLRKA